MLRKGVKSLKMFLQPLKRIVHISMIKKGIILIETDIDYDRIDRLNLRSVMALTLADSDSVEVENLNQFLCCVETICIVDKSITRNFHRLKITET